MIEINIPLFSEDKFWKNEMFIYILNTRENGKSAEFLGFATIPKKNEDAFLSDAENLGISIAILHRNEEKIIFMGSGPIPVSLRLLSLRSLKSLSFYTTAHNDINVAKIILRDIKGASVKILRNHGNELSIIQLAPVNDIKKYTIHSLIEDNLIEEDTETQKREEITEKRIDRLLEQTTVKEADIQGINDIVDENGFNILLQLIKWLGIPLEKKFVERLWTKILTGEIKENDEDVIKFGKEFNWEVLWRIYAGIAHADEESWVSLLKSIMGEIIKIKINEVEPENFPFQPKIYVRNVEIHFKVDLRKGWIENEKEIKKIEDKANNVLNILREHFDSVKYILIRTNREKCRRLFKLPSLKPEIKDALTKERIDIDLLRKEFEKNHLPISSKAEVIVEENAKQWKINDGEKEYKIVYEYESDGEYLCVYDLTTKVKKVDCRFFVNKKDVFNFDDLPERINDYHEELKKLIDEEAKKKGYVEGGLLRKNIWLKRLYVTLVCPNFLLRHLLESFGKNWIIVPSDPRGILFDAEIPCDIPFYNQDNLQQFDLPKELSIEIGEAFINLNKNIIL